MFTKIQFVTFWIEKMGYTKEAAEQLWEDCNGNVEEVMSVLEIEEMAKYWGLDVVFCDPKPRTSYVIQAPKND